MFMCWRSRAEMTVTLPRQSFLQAYHTFWICNVAVNEWTCRFVNLPLCFMFYVAKYVESERQWFLRADLRTYWSDVPYCKNAPSLYSYGAFELKELHAEIRMSPVPHTCSSGGCNGGPERSWAFGLHKEQAIFWSGCAKISFSKMELLMKMSSL
jgi:hypothetical protein